jgi:hypothetical protein
LDNRSPRGMTRRAERQIERQIDLDYSALEASGVGAIHFSYRPHIHSSYRHDRVGEKAPHEKRSE